MSSSRRKHLIGALVVIVIATCPTVGDIRLLWHDDGTRYWLLFYLVFAAVVAWHSHVLLEHSEDTDG